MTQKKGAFYFQKNEKFSERKPLFAHIVWKIIKTFFFLSMHAYFCKHTFFMYVQLLMMINGPKGTFVWNDEDYNVAFCASPMFDG
jgi:hypothetical protein